MTPDGDLITRKRRAPPHLLFLGGNLLPNASPLSLAAARNTLQIMAVCHPPGSAAHRPVAFLFIGGEKEDGKKKNDVQNIAAKLSKEVRNKLRRSLFSPSRISLPVSPAAVLLVLAISASAP